MEKTPKCPKKIWSYNQQPGCLFRFKTVNCKHNNWSAKKERVNYIQPVIKWASEMDTQPGKPFLPTCSLLATPSYWLKCHIIYKCIWQRYQNRISLINSINKQYVLPHQTWHSQQMYFYICVDCKSSHTSMYPCEKLKNGTFPSRFP